jgi:hypothetical protein
MTMSEPENNTTTAEQPARKRGPAKEKPVRTRRNYAAELAALQMKVDIAMKLLTKGCEKDPYNVDPVLAAIIELLT